MADHAKVKICNVDMSNVKVRDRKEGKDEGDTMGGLWACLADEHMLMDQAY